VPFNLRPDETRCPSQRAPTSRFEKRNILLLSLQHQHVPPTPEPGMNISPQEPLLLKLAQVGKVQAGIGGGNAARRYANAG
jgi:hypothetical protein